MTSWGVPLRIQAHDFFFIQYNSAVQALFSTTEELVLYQLFEQTQAFCQHSAFYLKYIHFKLKYQTELLNGYWILKPLLWDIDPLWQSIFCARAANLYPLSAFPCKTIDCKQKCGLLGLPPALTPPVQAHMFSYLLFLLYPYKVFIIANVIHSVPRRTKDLGSQEEGQQCLGSHSGGGAKWPRKHI